MADPRVEALEHRESMLIGGSLAEGMTGMGTVAVAVLALVGVLPQILLSVAVITLGAAFMLEGAAIARQFSRLLSEAREIDSSSLGGGITAEYLAGIAGIALGILSLANISPLILAPIAAIIFGGALIMGSGITSRLNTMAIHQKEENAMIRQVSREAISAAANIRVLIGIGAATLGILSLVGLSPILLTIIAVLGIGFSDLLSGTAITGRMISLFSGQ